MSSGPWIINKQSLLGEIASLRKHGEQLADRFRQAQERAMFNGRAALIGWATVAALAVLLAWKWH